MCVYIVYMYIYNVFYNGIYTIRYRYVVTLRQTHKLHAELINGMKPYHITYIIHTYTHMNTKSAKKFAFIIIEKYAICVVRNQWSYSSNFIYFSNWKLDSRRKMDRERNWNWEKEWNTPLSLYIEKNPNRYGAIFFSLFLVLSHTQKLAK